MLVILEDLDVLLTNQIDSIFYSEVHKLLITIIEQLTAISFNNIKFLIVTTVSLPISNVSQLDLQDCH